MSDSAIWLSTASAVLEAGLAPESGAGLDESVLVAFAEQFGRRLIEVAREAEKCTDVSAANIELCDDGASYIIPARYVAAVRMALRKSTPCSMT